MKLLRRWCHLRAAILGREHGHRWTRSLRLITCLRCGMTVRFGDPITVYIDRTPREH